MLFQIRERGWWEAKKTEGQFELRVKCDTHPRLYHNFYIRNTASTKYPKLQWGLYKYNDPESNDDHFYDCDCDICTEHNISDYDYNSDSSVINSD